MYPVNPLFFSLSFFHPFLSYPTLLGGQS
jgi:hypothetical protein